MAEGNVVSEFLETVDLEPHGEGVREIVQSFWEYFYNKYYVVSRKEVTILRTLFMRAGMYIGTAKSAPDILKINKPPGKTRGEMYRELIAQTVSVQEFYSALIKSGVPDFPDSDGSADGEEAERDQGAVLDPEMQALLGDGDVGGGEPAASVPELRIAEDPEDSSEDAPPQKPVALNPIKPA